MICKISLYAGNPYIQVRWSLSDVLARCNQRKIRLTRDEGLEVLIRIRKNHSQDEGISWGLVDLFIDEVVSERE